MAIRPLRSTQFTSAKISGIEISYPKKIPARIIDAVVTLFKKAYPRFDAWHLTIREYQEPTVRDSTWDMWGGMDDADGNGYDFATVGVGKRDSWSWEGRIDVTPHEPDFSDDEYRENPRRRRKVRKNPPEKVWSIKGRPVYVKIIEKAGSPSFYGGARVQVSNGWWADWPIKYADGRIAYDFPERIPDYAKKMVGKAFHYLESSIRKNGSDGITVERSLMGGFTLSTVRNGQRYHKRYFDYTVKEAKADFRRYIRQGGRS